MIKLGCAEEWAYSKNIVGVLFCEKTRKTVCAMKLVAKTNANTIYMKQNLYN